MTQSRKQCELRIINQGSVVANHAFVATETDIGAMIIVDLETKRAIFDDDTQDENGNPAVRLSANEYSHGISDEHSGLTTLSFPEYAGYSVFAARVSRYTLNVALINLDRLSETIA